MTRQDGIINAYIKKHGVIEDYTGGSIIKQLLRSEYNNYAELCEFCHEQPKPMQQWLNEEIKPLK